jgi:hypothetical protein
MPQPSDSALPLPSFQKWRLTIRGALVLGVSRISFLGLGMQLKVDPVERPVQRLLCEDNFGQNLHELLNFVQNAALTRLPAA